MRCCDYHRFNSPRLATTTTTTLTHTATTTPPITTNHNSTPELQCERTLSRDSVGPSLLTV
jgi:hypothetical protein